MLLMAQTIGCGCRYLKSYDTLTRMASGTVGLIGRRSAASVSNLTDTTTSYYVPGSLARRWTRILVLFEKDLSNRCLIL